MKFKQSHMCELIFLSSYLHVKLYRTAFSLFPTVFASSEILYGFVSSSFMFKYFHYAQNVIENVRTKYEWKGSMHSITLYSESQLTLYRQYERQETEKNFVFCTMKFIDFCFFFCWYFILKFNIQRKREESLCENLKLFLKMDSDLKLNWNQTKV